MFPNVSGESEKGGRGQDGALQTKKPRSTEKKCGCCKAKMSYRPQAPRTPPWPRGNVSSSLLGKGLKVRPHLVSLTLFDGFL